jgi:Uma2 family endonuclease
VNKGKNMETLLPQKTIYSYEQYLAKEQETQEKHDFFFGEIFNMAGTTDTHNLIVLRLSSLILNFLDTQNSKCKVFSENVKLELVKNQYYVYPDLMLICDKSDEETRTMKKYPTIIFEVLSNSTEDYDRGTKWKHYKTIPTLVYYVLVSQYEYLIEVYEKMNDFKWEYTTYTGLEQAISFDKLDFALNTTQIYKNIEL